MLKKHNLNLSAILYKVSVHSDLKQWRMVKLLHHIRGCVCSSLAATVRFHLKKGVNNIFPNQFGISRLLGLKTSSYSPFARRWADNDWTFTFQINCFFNNLLAVTSYSIERCKRDIDILFWLQCVLSKMLLVKSVLLCAYEAVMAQ